MKVKLIALAAVLFGFGAAQQQAEAANATFRCGAAAGQTCYFTIFYGGGARGSRNFTMGRDSKMFCQGSITHRTFIVSVSTDRSRMRTINVRQIGRLWAARLKETSPAA